MKLAVVWFLGSACGFCFVPNRMIRFLGTKRLGCCPNTSEAPSQTQTAKCTNCANHSYLIPTLYLEETNDCHDCKKATNNNGANAECKARICSTTIPWYDPGTSTLTAESEVECCGLEKLA